MTTISYNSHTIRTVEHRGKFMVSVSDLAKAMDMANGRITRDNLPKECTAIIKMSTKGGIQPVKMVDIRGAIKLLKKSKKPGSVMMIPWLLANVFVDEAATIPEEKWASLSTK